MSKHINSSQRYHLFVERQNKGTKRAKTQAQIAAEIGVHPSSVSREYKRNATGKGGYNDLVAQRKADERKQRSAPNNKKSDLLWWRIEQWIIEEQWSPAQIVGVLRKEGTRICKQTIYNHIHADPSGKLLANTRHKGKYNKSVKKTKRPTKSKIKNRVSIHDRPVEANGSRFGDWEMDLIIGKNGYGAILVLTERSTNYAIMEKLPHGRNARHVAKAVIRLLYAYRLKGVLTITTDNGFEFAAHQLITKDLNGVTVYFADSYCSWQKGLVEYTNKLIRQYIPKGSDFSTVTPQFIKRVQSKLNKRPREKLNFSTPMKEFFKQFS